jgi:5'-3' exonuclease
MGIGGNLLSRILRTAGRPVDLSQYQKGVEDRTNHRDAKRQRILRPLRIGLDVSVWIAQRAHGNGAMLLDDKYLTDYGKGQKMLDISTDGANSLLKAENCRAYIQLCADQVLTRILRLKDMTHADLCVVMDGASPPIKKYECLKRQQRKSLAEQGRDSTDETKSVDKRVRDARKAGAGTLLCDIIEELMQMLRKKDIRFIVAPYEADGQLGYLARSGEIDLVISEDSDLLCHDIPTILFKYDGQGKGILVQRKDLGAMEVRSNSLSLLDFSSTMIAIMFVCIGCDYCSSLDGIGPVAARDIVRDVFSKQEDNTPVLRRILDKLYTKSREDLDAEARKKYESEFLAAIFAYRHPVIYSNTLQTYMLANNPPHGSDSILMKFQPYKSLCYDVARHKELLGAFPEPRLQKAIIEGWVSPRTQKPYYNVNPPQYVSNLFESNITPNVSHETNEPLRESVLCALSFSSSQVEVNCESQDLQVHRANPYRGEKHLNCSVMDTCHGLSLQEYTCDTQEFEHICGSKNMVRMPRPTADEGNSEFLTLLNKETVPRNENWNNISTQDTPQKSYFPQEDIKSPFLSTQSSNTSNKYSSQSTSKSGDALSPPLLP